MDAFELKRRTAALASFKLPVRRKLMNKYQKNIHLKNKQKVRILWIFSEINSPNYRNPLWKLENFVWIDIDPCEMWNELSYNSKSNGTSWMLVAVTYKLYSLDAKLSVAYFFRFFEGIFSWKASTFQMKLKYYQRKCFSTLDLIPQ